MSFGKFPEYQKDVQTYLLDVSGIASTIAPNGDFTIKASRKGQIYCQVLLPKGPDGIEEEFTWKQFLDFITHISMKEDAIIKRKTQSSTGFDWSINYKPHLIQITFEMNHPESSVGESQQHLCHITYNIDRGTFKIKISGLPFFTNQSDSGENLQMVCAEYGPRFKGSQFPNKQYREITFPFCGIPDEATQGTFNLPKVMDTIIRKLMLRNHGKFYYFPENRIDLLYRFSYINIIRLKLEEELQALPKFKDFFNNVGGTIFTHYQKKIDNLNLMEYQIHFNEAMAAELVNLLEVNSTYTFASFIYIVPQIISILQFAQDCKESLGHDKIHIQIDCSFKVTKPFVYCVPRVEVFHTTIPLGVVITPSERSETFKLFFDSLQKLIDDYNRKNSQNPMNFDYKRDVFFLSDLGSAEKKFFDDNNLPHAYCLRHYMNSFGADTPLCKIASEIFLIKSLDQWLLDRENYFKQLKHLFEHTASPKDQQKISDFASEIGLSKNISENENVDPWDENYTYRYNDSLHLEKELKDNLCNFLPFLRDFSATTTNATEGAHAKYNKISLKFTLLNRIVALVKMILLEIKNKSFNGPFSRRLAEFRKHQFSNSTECEGDRVCPIGTFMKSVFGVSICHHHCDKAKLSEFNSFLNSFTSWKNMFNINTNLVVYEPIHINVTSPWIVSKKYIHIRPKGIKNHIFKIKNEESYFVRAMKYCYYWITKYDQKSMSLEDLSMFGSHLLGKHFCLETETKVIPRNEKLDDELFSSYLNKMRQKIRNRCEKINSSSELYSVVSTYYKNNYEYYVERVTKIPLFCKNSQVQTDHTKITI